MNAMHPLSGVYAAALTPLNADFSIQPEGLYRLLTFLSARGCHGVLLFGTTGEGPSLGIHERGELLRAAVEFRRAHTAFRLLAGTGAPSLEDAVEMTRAAFDLGVDGVVTLPPYYFRKVSDEGLYRWYAQLIQRAVPAGGWLLGYHIPSLSGVPLSLDLLERLLTAFPGRFAGIKDSSADAEQARALGARFGEGLAVLNGSDRLFSLALQNRAAGCITALANLVSPDLRAVWNASLRGEEDAAAQARLDAARNVSERFPPAPPLLKALLAARHGFPEWAVRPPLLPLTDELRAHALAAWDSRLND
ncbi:MAG: dihydrodipicolinate synthase family protein [Chloroflexi bacterium]|nr:dihydrodipicolinate synthase family protein [Chloroflexota bacterium]